MANVKGKAERKEAEVAKLQRTVVNKEGQVGLPANIIVFVLSKCIFHREAVTKSNSMERWERREPSWRQSWRGGREPWGWRLSPQSEMISIFFQFRGLLNKHLFAFYINSLYTLFRSGITFTFSNIVREDPEKKFR